MKRSNYIKKIPSILFAVTLVAFILFYIYVFNHESLSVDRKIPTHGYTVLSDATVELSDDPAAPIGIRKIYRMTLPTDPSPENYLFFNIAHHDIQVYFEDDLVYSLTCDENNRIAKNVSSNWCILYTGPKLAGREITVVLTPLFKAAVSKTPEFLLGAPYAFGIQMLSGEMPLLVLSILCIMLGILILIVFLYYHFVLKNTKEIFYLGLFSIFIGLWKLTDLRGMSLLMPNYTLSIGYISVGSLFLTSLCLMMHFTTTFVKGKRIVLRALSFISALVCMAVLIMQLAGIAEFRQNLALSHILLILSLISVPITALVNRIVYKEFGLWRTRKLLWLLIMGIAVDLTFYYINNQNGLLSFAIIGLVIYTLIMFLMSIQDSNKKSYTDLHTGLINRTRWAELMNEELNDSKPYAIMMIDMNGLKRINDVYGHAAGDRMIFQLSDILRKTLPSFSRICRWGGDEFVVLLPDTDRENLDLQVANLFSECEKHNAENPEIPLHFAVGAVLSSEHAGVSKQELFRMADEQMYQNKKEWYENR